MNIFQYINSEAIRDYLMSIKYAFTPLEAAWLIFQCQGLSMKEKHRAWEELMKEMSDCEMSGVSKILGCSLFNFLKRYIKLEDDMYLSFLSRQDNCIYIHAGQYKGEDGTNSECFDFYPFSSVDTCVNSLLTAYPCSEVLSGKTILTKFPRLS